MAPPSDPNAFLKDIAIVVPAARAAMKLKPRAAVAGQPKPRTLETEAMRWTYLLRTRQRWLDTGSAAIDHERDAMQTLADFGLGPTQLARIAEARRVVVRMPYAAEELGWAGRIFPWEYVIASATRRLRKMSNHHFTVMRQLVPAAGAGAWERKPVSTVLFVSSAPGGLGEQYGFDDELRRVSAALGQVVPVHLKDPTWRQLQAKIQSMRPDVVHLSGFDNLQGLKALRDLLPADAPIEIAGEPARPLSRCLADERGLPDGLLMVGEHQRVEVVPALRLAEALTGGVGHCARFVAVSVENSAARTAALIVAQRAAVAAVGFQDVIDNALSDYFFELVYTQLVEAEPYLPRCFERAWLRLRQEPASIRATGVALWASASLMDDAQQADEPQAAELRQSAGPPRILFKAESELNYSVLHNNGPLFSEFVVERGDAVETDWLTAEIEIQLGAETARYSRRFLADRSRIDLRPEIYLPLTASLARSNHEAINSTLVVQLTHNQTPLARESRPLRLLPVDQWRDNAKDGQWLPSFVLPRDPAVVRAVEQAQRYVRVLRDNPSAGFEGYQAVSDPSQEDQLREVDLQVQALWATLLHEWQLGYINPPPTYSAKLDSQRLRTPSTILAARSGTCIDLALLLAACLELIDVYPVVFLLNGHALPGYWRHDSFQNEFISAHFAPGQAPLQAEAGRDSSSSAQSHGWQALGKAAHREITDRIRARQLVPVETVRLTEHCGFVEAIEAGVEALSDAAEFHSVLDIVKAREKKITPLPIVGHEPGLFDGGMAPVSNGGAR